MAAHYLDFERPIADLESKIEELSKLSETAGPGAFETEIQALRDRAQELRVEAYANLDAWQKTMVARHPERPHLRDYLASLIDEFVSRRVRGLIVISTMSSHEGLSAAQEKGIPVVFVDRSPVGLKADSIVLDNYSGARAAVEQLLSLGHTRIGYVSHLSRLQPHWERIAGFSDAMTAAGIETWREFAEDGAFDIDSAVVAVEKLLSRDPRPTAIFTGNNRITIGALKAIANIAPETALIGFDDFDVASMLGVTTVSYDPAEMGRLAAQIVLEAPGLRSQEPRSIVVPTRIVQRGSGERPPVD